MVQLSPQNSQRVQKHTCYYKYTLLHTIASCLSSAAGKAKMVTQKSTRCRACGTAAHRQMLRWRRRTATCCAFAAISPQLMGRNYRCLDLDVVNASLSLKRHIFLCLWKSLWCCHSKPFIIWNIAKETADTLLLIKSSVRCGFHFFSLTTVCCILPYRSTESSCVVLCSYASRWSCLWCWRNYVTDKDHHYNWQLDVVYMSRAFGQTTYRDGAWPHYRSSKVWMQHFSATNLHIGDINGLLHADPTRSASKDFLIDQMNPGEGEFSFCCIFVPNIH